MIEDILRIYDALLLNFPDHWHGPISLGLTILIAGAIFHVIRKSGVWLVLLVILVPALIPTVKGVGLFIFELLKALFGRATS